MFIPEVESSLWRSKSHDICVAFRTLGAVSPETALGRDALTLVDPDALERLIQRGVIRSVARGALYLDEASLQRSTTRRYLAMTAFWLLLMAVPIVLISLLS